MSRCPLIVLTMSSREFPEYLLWRDMYVGLYDAGMILASIDTTVDSLPVEEIIGVADGLILGGGGDVDPSLYGGDPDDPTLSGVVASRDRNEARMLDLALQRSMPVLGICRGAQLINVIHGGTLFQDLRRDHGIEVEHRGRESELDTAIHGVTVAGDSLLAGVLGTDGVVDVNSGHHQGIARLGDGLVATARSADGLVEAFEARAPGPLLGVQWHPENLWRTQAHATKLLDGFAKWCSPEETRRDSATPEVEPWGHVREGVPGS